MSGQTQCPKCGVILTIGYKKVIDLRRVFLVFLVVLFGALVSCLSAGPERPGVYCDQSGWKSWIRVSGAAYESPLATLFPLDEFESNKNVVSRTFSILFYYGDAAPTLSGIKTHAVMIPLDEFKISKGSIYEWSFPKELQGQTYLVTIEDVSRWWGAGDALKKKYAEGRVVYRLKYFDCPPGKWVLETTSAGRYFIEVR